jgi:hypothetical protein
VYGAELESGVPFSRLNEGHYAERERERERERGLHGRPYLAFFTFSGRMSSLMLAHLSSLRKKERERKGSKAS